MLDMSGVEVLEHLRRDPPALSSIPVLVVTAWGHAAMQAGCLELGVKGFFSKPFSLRELATGVEAYLV